MNFTEVIRVAQEATQVETVTINGIEYTNREIFIPPTRRTPPTLRLNTLSGIAKYLEAIDEEHVYPSFIHVEDHATVHLYGQMAVEYEDRHCILTATAKHYITPFKFEVYIPVEKMIIALKSCFEPTEDLDNLVAIIGNLKEEKISRFSDDGCTQTVTARTGLGVVEDRPVPNRVTLRPFRTFSEIQQPSGLFVFRMQQAAKTGEPPTCALFEADGAAWKIEAIQNIVDHLTHATMGRFPIIS
jgi:hypothetical protein